MPRGRPKQFTDEEAARRKALSKKQSRQRIRAGTAATPSHTLAVGEQLISFTPEPVDLAANFTQALPPGEDEEDPPPPPLHPQDDEVASSPVDSPRGSGHPPPRTREWIRPGRPSATPAVSPTAATNSPATSHSDLDLPADGDMDQIRFPSLAVVDGDRIHSTAPSRSQRRATPPRPGESLVGEGPAHRRSGQTAEDAIVISSDASSSPGTPGHPPRDRGSHRSVDRREGSSAPREGTPVRGPPRGRRGQTRRTIRDAVRSQPPDPRKRDQLAAMLAQSLFAPASLVPGVHLPGEHSRQGRPVRGDGAVVAGRWFQPWPDEPLSIPAFLDYLEPLLPPVLDMSVLKKGQDLEAVSASDRKSAFCGFGLNETRQSRPFLDISLDQQRPIDYDVFYDVDSYVGLANSLAVFRTGLKAIFVQRPTPSIEASLHLGTFKVFYHDDHDETVLSEAELPLHEIPQETIGRCAGNDDLELVVFFPHAVRTRQRMSKLPEEVFADWVDVFLRVVHQCLPAPLTVSVPSNYHVAKSLSLLRSKNQVATPSEPRRQMLSHPIQPAYLESLWPEIRRRLHEGRFGFLLQDPLLVVNARGIKASTADRTWRGMRVKTDAVLTQHIDTAFINLAYFDYGRVWGRPISSVEGHAVGGDVPLYALKYLREVAAKIMNIFSDSDNSKSFTCREYPQYFLCGVGSLTVEPHPDSEHVHLGYLYGQFYNTVKNFWAAGDNYLAANRAVDDLGLDPAKLRVLQHAAHAVTNGSRAASSEALIAAFLHLVSHVKHVTQSATGKSSAIRDEHRSRDDLWVVVDRFMVLLETHRAQIARGDPVPEYPDGSIEADLVRRVFRPRVRPHRPGGNAFLCLQTPVFLRWTAWNINRFVYGVSFIFSQVAAGQVITWEQTRAISTFFRAIAVFLGSSTPRDAYRYWTDLCASKIDAQGRPEEPQQGFGFARSMSETGFPWFMDKFNWDKLVFQPRLSAVLPFRRLNIEGRLRRHGRIVKSTHDLSHRIELCDQFLIRYGRVPACRHLLFTMFNQICALVFRRTVFSHMEANIKPDKLDDCLAGQVALCADNLASVLVRGRGGFEVKHNTRSTYLHWDDLRQALFGDQVPRHAMDSEHILVFQSAYGTIEHTLGQEEAADWASGFLEYLRATEWVFPYPQNNRFMNRKPEAKVHPDGKPWLFWADVNDRILDIQDGNGGRAHAVPLPANWESEYQGHWRDKSGYPMRGRPALDDSYIDADMGEFLTHLRELAGADFSDQDSEDDGDYDPTHDERVPLRSLPRQPGPADPLAPGVLHPTRRSRRGHPEEEEDTLLSLSDDELQALDDVISQAEQVVDIDDIVSSP